MLHEDMFFFFFFFSFAFPSLELQITHIHVPEYNYTQNHTQAFTSWGALLKASMAACAGEVVMKLYFTVSETS